MEVKGKRGKPSVMVTEDDEFKKVNFDKFAKLATVFQVRVVHIEISDVFILTLREKEELSLLETLLHCPMERRLR